jgi:hypothetical protein
MDEGIFMEQVALVATRWIYDTSYLMNHQIATVNQKKSNNKHQPLQVISNVVWTKRGI